MNARAPTCFIGRDDELKKLDALTDGFRVVSLFGPGGFGKSRLAAEWARERDHVIVDLGGLNRDDSLARIEEALGRSPQTIVLDHLPHSDDEIARVLRDSSYETACIVTTSRHRPSFEFSAAMRVGALDTSRGDAADLLAWHLRRLGVEDFARDDARRIGEQLDGIPLLLEKAARYAMLVGVSKSAQTLEETGTSEFFQAMEVAEDAIIDLEAIEELETMLAAAVFEDDFDLDSLVDVTGLSRAQSVGQLAILETRGVLNLHHVTDSVRYRLVGVVRDLVLSRHPPGSELLERHADAVLKRPQAHSTDDLHAIFDRACDEALDFAQGIEAMVAAAQRPDVDIQRLRDAAGSMSQQSEFEGHVAILLGIARHELHAGELDRLEATLDSAERAASSPADRALVNDALAGRERVAGNPEAAARLYEKALAALDDSGPYPRVEARVRSNFGAVLWEFGEREGAHRQMEQALRLFRSVEDRRAEGVVLANRGVMFHHEGDLEAAREAHHKALSLHREVGHDRFEAITLFDLGTLAHERGEFRAARRLHSEAASLLELVGDLRQAALARAAVGALDAALGETTLASRQRVELGDDVYADAIALYQRLASAYEDLILGRWTPDTDLDVEAAPDEIRLPARLLERLARDTTLVVMPDCGELRAPDQSIADISRRDAPRNILEALVEGRLEGDGPIHAEHLIAAGWPDEMIEPGAATNRLHVALSALRKLGLRDVLQTAEDGWMLSDEVIVLVTADPMAP